MNRAQRAAEAAQTALNRAQYTIARGVRCEHAVSIYRVLNRSELRRNAFSTAHRRRPPSKSGRASSRSRAESHRRADPGRAAGAARTVGRLAPNRSQLR
jgi:hypothetical protein